MNKEYPEGHFLSQKANLDEAFRRGAIHRREYLRRLMDEFSSLKKTEKCDEEFLRQYDPLGIESW